MPVVQPYYDPSFDAGQPFIVQYFAAFLGERSAMNKQIMAARLKQMDPTERLKAQQMLMDNIARLEQRKAAIRQASVEKAGAIVDSMIKGIYQENVALINQATAVHEANQRLRGIVVQETMDIQKLKAGETIVSDKTSDYVGTMADTLATKIPEGSEDPGAIAYNTVKNMMTAAYSGEDEGDPSSMKRKAIAKQAWDTLSTQYNEALQGNNTQRAGAIWQGMEILKQEYFNGADPNADFQAQLGKTTDQIVEEGVNLRLGGAGAAITPVRSLFEELMGVPAQMKATTPAPTPTPTAQAVGTQRAAPGAPTPAPGAFAAPPTQQPGAPAQAAQAPVGGLLGQLIEYTSGTPGIDTAIARSEAELERMRAEPEMRPEDIYAGFGKNYLLSTPFKYQDPDTERYMRMFLELPRVEQENILAEIESTKGPIRRGHRVLEGMSEEMAGRVPSGYMNMPGPPSRPLFTWLSDTYDTITAEPDPAKRGQMMHELGTQLGTLAAQHPWAHSMYQNYLERSRNPGSGPQLLQDWAGAIDEMASTMEAMTPEEREQAAIRLEGQSAKIPFEIQQAEQARAISNLERLENVALGEFQEGTLTPERESELDWARIDALEKWGIHVPSQTAASLKNAIANLTYGAVAYREEGDAAKADELSAKAEELVGRLDAIEGTYKEIWRLQKSMQDSMAAAEDPNLDPGVREQHVRAAQQNKDMIKNLDAELSRAMAPHLTEMPTGPEPLPPASEYLEEPQP